MVRFPVPFVSNRISYAKIRNVVKSEPTTSFQSEFFRPEKFCIESNGFNEFESDTG